MFLTLHDKALHYQMAKYMFEQLNAGKQDFRKLYVDLRIKFNQANIQQVVDVLSNAKVLAEFELEYKRLNYLGWVFPSAPTVLDWALLEIDPSLTFGIEFELATKFNESEMIKHIQALTKYPVVPGDTVKDAWTVGHDGSLRTGEGFSHTYELRPPVLKGRRGVRELYTVLNWIASQGIFPEGKDGEYTGNHREKFAVGTPFNTGTHIHIGTFTNTADAEKICHFYVQNAEYLKTLVSRDRRENSYCRWMSRFQEHYNACNYRSLGEHSTVEFRAHQGTLSFEKIISWVILTQKIVRFALKDESYRKRSWKNFFDKINLHQYHRKFFSERFKVLNPGSDIPEME